MKLLLLLLFCGDNLHNFNLEAESLVRADLAVAGRAVAQSGGHPELDFAALTYQLNALAQTLNDLIQSESLGLVVVVCTFLLCREPVQDVCQARTAHAAGK